MDDDLDGGHRRLFGRLRRHISHLKGIVAGRQGAVTHGVLSQTERGPLIVDTLHPVTEHGLPFVAVIQGGEGDGEGAVAFVQLDGTGNRYVV